VSRAIAIALANKVANTRRAHDVLEEAMTRTVTATEAKNRLGALMAQAQQEPVIVEIHGAPKVAIVSISDLQELEALREAEERRRAVERLRTIREHIAARNADLSSEEAAAIIEQATADIREMRRARRKGYLEH
jgi:prevent-host-death family protein